MPIETQIQVFSKQVNELTDLIDSNFEKINQVDLHYKSTCAAIC